MLSMNVHLVKTCTLEKYAMGCQSPSMCCCKTPPTATSEASVLIHVGASALEGSVYQSFLDSGKSSIG